jgi:hypothetical protein
MMFHLGTRRYKTQLAPGTGECSRLVTLRVFKKDILGTDLKTSEGRGDIRFVRLRGLLGGLDQVSRANQQLTTYEDVKLRS